jgi:hypothetical protein
LLDELEQSGVKGNTIVAFALGQLAQNDKPNSCSS